MNNLDIVKIREEFGFTQQQFADFIGVDRRTVINWEKGRLIPESKVMLIEMLLEKKRNNNTKAVLDETSNSKIDLTREVEELKDHIKTLKNFLEEKSTISEFYKAEISKLKEEIEALKSGEK